MSYAKTEAGRLEIEQRTLRLPAAMRSILLMVDGQRSALELRTLVEGLRAPADTLDQLCTMGLIAPTGPGAASEVPAEAATVAQASSTAAQEYSWLYDRMSAAVTQHLGLKGYFMQLKIERCGDAPALLALLPELKAALSKARGAEFSERWMKEMQPPVGE